MSEGPERTGPEMTQLSSVKTVTSRAIELSFSSGDCAYRQMRPPPGGNGSTSVMRRGTASARVRRASRRSTSITARGPAPTITRSLTAR